jgi:hypothetical protein
MQLYCTYLHNIKIDRVYLDEQQEHRTCVSDALPLAALL